MEVSRERNAHSAWERIHRSEWTGRSTSARAKAFRKGLRGRGATISTLMGWYRAGRYDLVWEVYDGKILWGLHRRGKSIKQDIEDIERDEIRREQREGKR